MIAFFQQIFGVALKDLTIEVRAPVRAFSVLFFALVILVMVAFAAGSTTKILQDIAGGTLWIAILLTSTRALDQSLSTEFEDHALEELLLWPVEPAAIFYGKAIANALVLWVVAALLTPLLFVIYDAPLFGSFVELVALIALGCAAIAAPGTLYATLTAQARGGAVLLPLLLFPLVVPALVAAARGTTVVMEGDPMRQAPAWLVVLVLFNLIHWAVAGVLFRYVIEEP
ncbi:MAG: transcriptional regulator [Deltaproteobacteria bacterium]|nr:MAG: transcriptional regulator [Deltaproteobacteria bacterium]